MKDEEIKQARLMLLTYIRQRISDKKITQQELADRTGFKQASISRMLTAKYSPTLDNLLALCDAADCFIFVVDKNADDDLCQTMRERWGESNSN